jgi:hypothetical protein
MQISEQAFQTTCQIVAPCCCNAPIAYTAIVMQGSLEEDTSFVGITLFRVNIAIATVNEIFTNIPKDAETDDLALHCTKCGRDWTSMNPLFFS